MAEEKERIKKEGRGEKDLQSITLTKIPVESSRL